MPTRRDVLAIGAISAGCTLARAAFASPGGKKEKPEEQVSPGEDLMREHGVLRRVLLIYGEARRRLDASADLDLEQVGRAARIVRRFVQDYHEQLEERELFPRFEKAHKLVDLVHTLREQHQAGRSVTAGIESQVHGPTDRRKLSSLMEKFIRMYEPHAAREDTVLFPAFHELVSPPEYAALGEKFEGEERRMLGKDGFEKMVQEVTAIEKALGIYDLAQFTPRT